MCCKIVNIHLWNGCSTEKSKVRTIAVGLRGGVVIWRLGPSPPLKFPRPSLNLKSTSKIQVQAQDFDFDSGDLTGFRQVHIPSCRTICQSHHEEEKIFFLSNIKKWDEQSIAQKWFSTKVISCWRQLQISWSNYHFLLQSKKLRRNLALLYGLFIDGLVFALLLNKREVEEEKSMVQKQVSHQIGATSFDTRRHICLAPLRILNKYKYKYKSHTMRG